MTAKLIRMLVIASIVFCAPSCTSFEVVGSGDTDLGANRKSGSGTVHGTFWGWEHWSEPDFATCDKGWELYKVEYHQNALYTLATVATLGLYVPQDVQWWCAKRPVKKKKPTPVLQDDPKKD